MKLNKLNAFAMSALLLTGFSVPAYAEQYCDTNITSTAPDARFNDLGNGEVEDLKTGLVWQRCSIGQTWNGSDCTGEIKQLTWLQALNEAQALGNGYRLPNFKEAMSVVERQCKSPALNSTIFKGISDTGYYWTSSPLINDGKQAIIFDYSSGVSARHVTDAVDKEGGALGPINTIAVREK